VTFHGLPTSLPDLRRALATELRLLAIRPADQVERLLDEHLTDSELRRILVTARHIPVAATAGAHLVDLGGTMFWLPIFRMLGYGRISFIGRGGGAYREYFRAGDHAGPAVFHLDADAEIDPYPLADASATCVVSFEVLEHFAGDPMHCVSEVNRILSSGGHFFLTTPNVLYSNNIVNILVGQHPSGWSVYTNSYADRHNREYTPFEVKQLLECGGFSIQRLATETIVKPAGKRRLVGHLASLLSACLRQVPLDLRREKILALARKTGPLVERFPAWLYNLYGRSAVTVNPSWARRSAPDR
jgi:SAM-dependent methyltransferase